MRLALLRGQLCALPSPAPRHGWVSPLWMGVPGGCREGRSAVQPQQHQCGERWGRRSAEPCKGEMLRWAVPCTPHNTCRRVTDAPTGCKSVHGAG